MPPFQDGVLAGTALFNMASWCNFDSESARDEFIFSACYANTCIMLKTTNIYNSDNRKIITWPWILLWRINWKNGTKDFGQFSKTEPSLKTTAVQTRDTNNKTIVPSCHALFNASGYGSDGCANGVPDMFPAHLCRQDQLNASQKECSPSSNSALNSEILKVKVVPSSTFNPLNAG